MEAVMSVVAGELLNQIISFMINKYTDRATIDERVKRLEQLLLRIHAVVNEADGRYIINPWMLMQLKLLVASMYQGYYMLDIFRYKSLVESGMHEEVTNLYTWLTYSIPVKRPRTVSALTRSFSHGNVLPSVLENLETAVANMNEFVLLLMGCKSMCRRPYDTYLYVDNFMFGRHVEKQQVINLLLQNPGRDGPMVIPITGGYRVGKKALVGHVCNNDYIQSHFPSIMFINGDCIWRMEHASFSNKRTLIVVEFLTDVADDDWLKFYSTFTRTAAEGSKVIIISRIENVARFGTVKSVFLNSLSHEEFSYLFKKLAFGSTDEKDYPHLTPVANELALLLAGSLIPANVIADLLRRNLNSQFWFRILRRFKGMVDNNLSKYGEHPKGILENERPIDLSAFISSSCSSSLRLMPPRVEMDKSPEKKPPNVSLGDLIRGCAIPNGEFMLVAWESRIPPYTKHVCVAARTDEKNGCRTSLRKRRPTL